MSSRPIVRNCRSSKGAVDANSIHPGRLFLWTVVRVTPRQAEQILDASGRRAAGFQEALNCGLTRDLWDTPPDDEQLGPVGSKNCIGRHGVALRHVLNDANDPLLTSVRHVFAHQQSPLASSSDMFGRPQKV